MDETYYDYLPLLCNSNTTTNMRKLTALLTVLLFCAYAHAQQAAAVDSIKSALEGAKTLEERVHWLDILSRTLMNVDLKEAEEYGNKLILLAEESRDRKLMIKAYNSNGVRCSYFAGSKDYTSRSIEYFNKSLSIARQSRLEEEAGGVLLKLSAIHLNVPDIDKAFDYTNQAFSIISTLKNDSLTAEAYISYGNVFLSKNYKILALRNYLLALRLAEDLKDPELRRKSYTNLATFYSGIKDHDKAIDYSLKAYHELANIQERGVPYQRAVDLNNIGKLYGAKKNYDIAIDYFERSLRLADTLKFPTLRVPAYISILNQYLQMNEPRKALEYFNSASGQGLKDYLMKFGFAGAVDQAYGTIYTQLGKYDSAGFYFDKSNAYFSKEGNDFTKMFRSLQLGYYYGKIDAFDKAIASYLSAKEYGDKLNQLEIVEAAAKYLDTLYTRKGDYQSASKYNSVYYQYKDSIATLNKANELAQVEAADEQLRQARIDKEKLEAKRKRYNIQYMAITIGIAGLFILMVMMGMFKVSATTIKLIGFFTFLMLFEFIFLIFKKNIASITEGEPWKDLLFMIGLAALLLPFHHWVEHKVIHYLTSHNRLTGSGKGLVNRVFRRNRTAAK